VKRKNVRPYIKKDRVGETRRKYPSSLAGAGQALRKGRLRGKDIGRGKSIESRRGRSPWLSAERGERSQKEARSSRTYQAKEATQTVGLTKGPPGPRKNSNLP